MVMIMLKKILSHWWWFKMTITVTLPWKLFSHTHCCKNDNMSSTASKIVTTIVCIGKYNHGDDYAWENTIKVMIIQNDNYCHTALKTFFTHTLLQKWQYELQCFKKPSQLEAMVVEKTQEAYCDSLDTRICLIKHTDL